MSLCVSKWVVTPFCHQGAVSWKCKIILKAKRIKNFNTIPLSSLIISWNTITCNHYMFTKSASAFESSVCPCIEALNQPIIEISIIFISIWLYCCQYMYLGSITWNPESSAWNPESKTVLDNLTWGKGSDAWIRAKTTRNNK